MKVKQCFKYIHELCINNMDTNYDEKVIENIPNDFISNDSSRKMLNKIKVIFNDLLDKKDELLEFSIKYDAWQESAYSVIKLILWILIIEFVLPIQVMLSLLLTMRRWNNIM